VGSTKVKMTYQSERRTTVRRTKRQNPWPSGATFCTTSKETNSCVCDHQLPQPYW